MLIGSEKVNEHPSNAKILHTIDQFARRVIMLEFNELSKIKLGSAIYANNIILGLGVREYREIFYLKLMLKLLKEIFRDSPKNLEVLYLNYAMTNSFSYVYD